MTTLQAINPTTFKSNGLTATGGAAAAFSPSDITGLKLWLNAESLVLSNDDPVATWTDDSGTGNDVTEATNRPLYKTGGLNSKPYVYFDGTNDILLKSSPTGLPTGANARTVFVVAECRSIANYKSIYSYGTAAANQIFSLAFHSTTQLLSWCYSNDDAATTTLANNTGYYFMHQYTGTNIVMRQNGSEIYNAADTINTGSTGFSVGNWVNAGAAGNVNVYEVLIYDSTISGADLTNIESYFATKYGL